MAKSSEKRIIYENKKYRLRLILTEIIINIIVLNIKPKIDAIFYIQLIPELLIAYYFIKISTPSFKKKNNKKILVSSGKSLRSKGIISMGYDFLYVNWAVRLFSLYSQNFYWLYLIIPISFIYEFIYKPYKKANKRNYY
ncbi:hypothetical protein TCON_1153 [Astathelohania contejeani]|uniref:DUF788 domain-containing protein n=1 Tax=Astathelohania contejeani TaxID=164912 RepID=A0ABQ7HZL1_9MICR|nr:hypothetical protein TCON_1153 [Thelohania contejeani]